MSVTATTGDASPTALTSSENMTRDELLLANRRLQQDNEWIKGELYKLRLEQRLGGPAKKPSAAAGADSGSNPAAAGGGAAAAGPDAAAEADERAMEILTYVNQLRVDGATIIRQHEDLLDLRQRCTFYATALEETTAHVETLKQLLAALQAKTTA